MSEKKHAKHIRKLLVIGLCLANLPTSVARAGAEISSGRQQLAFLHVEHHGRVHARTGAHHHGHRPGCFVTTTPQNHARGIRHWVSPCPHRERRHMNPYHAPYHRLHEHGHHNGHKR